MDINALFKVQCGLFVVTAEAGGRMGGCITNTLMQQSHVPVKLSLTIEKSHFTHDLVMEKKSCSVAVLSDRDPQPLITRFGFSSGRDVNKFEGIAYAPDRNGNPMPESGSIAAVLALQVYETVDVGTHTIFLCTPDALDNRDGEGITYSQYRSQIKNQKQKEKEKTAMAKYVCTVCGYVYDPEVGDPDSGIAPGTPWEEVPEDYVCPACGVGKDMFEAE